MRKKIKILSLKRKLKTQGFDKSTWSTCRKSVEKNSLKFSDILNWKCFFIASSGDERGICHPGTTTWKNIPLSS